MSHLTGADERCACRRANAGTIAALVWSEVVGMLTNPDRLLALAQTAVDARSNAAAAKGGTSPPSTPGSTGRRGASALRWLTCYGGETDAGIIEMATRKLEAALDRRRRHGARLAAGQPGQGRPDPAALSTWWP